MHNKKIFILLSGLLLFIGCQSKKEQAPLDIEIEIIDICSLKMIPEIIPEHIIKDTKYILLNNSSDDILFKGIDQIKIVNNMIYILDRKLKKLIVFDSMGVGIGKVGQRGQGPEEYLRISDFDVNDNGDIYFIDGTVGADRLFVFDKNLQFVSRKSMPFEADIIHCLPNNKLLFGLSSWNQGESANKKIVVTDTDLKTEQSYMEYDEYQDDSYWISNYTFVNTGENILYNKPIDNFVYQLSEAGVPTKAYLFDFGKKMFRMNIKKTLRAIMKNINISYHLFIRVNMKIFKLQIYLKM